MIKSLSSKFAALTLIYFLVLFDKPLVPIAGVEGSLLTRRSARIRRFNQKKRANQEKEDKKIKEANQKEKANLEKEADLKTTANKSVDNANFSAPKNDKQGKLSLFLSFLSSNRTKDTQNLII